MKKNLPNFIIFCYDSVVRNYTSGEMVLLGNGYNSRRLPKGLYQKVLCSLRKKFGRDKITIIGLDGDTFQIFTNLREMENAVKYLKPENNPPATLIMYRGKFEILRFSDTSLGPTDDPDMNDMIASLLLKTVSNSQIVKANYRSRIIRIGPHPSIMDMPSEIKKFLCKECPCGCNGLREGAFERYLGMHCVDFAVNVLGEKVPLPIQQILKHKPSLLF
jgi:hypothetical protein